MEVPLEKKKWKISEKITFCMLPKIVEYVTNK
jgi:hypothetical protein